MRLWRSLLLAVALFAPVHVLAHGTQPRDALTGRRVRINGAGRRAALKRRQVRQRSTELQRLRNPSNLHDAPFASDEQQAYQQILEDARAMGPRLSTRLRRPISIDTAGGHLPESALLDQALTSLEALLPALSFLHGERTGLVIKLGVRTGVVAEQPTREVILDVRADPRSWIRVLSQRPNAETQYQAVRQMRLSLAMRRATRGQDPWAALQEVFAQTDFGEPPEFTRIIGGSHVELHVGFRTNQQRVRLSEQPLREFYFDHVTKTVTFYESGRLVRRMARYGRNAEDFEQEDYWYNADGTLGFTTVMDADGVERMLHVSNPDVRHHNLNANHLALGVDHAFARIASRLSRTQVMHVGVFDSGGDFRHPVLAASADFANPEGAPLSNDVEQTNSAFDAYEAFDASGDLSHGSHVAGIATHGSELIRARLQRIRFGRRAMLDEHMVALSTSASLNRVVNASLSIRERGSYAKIRAVMAAHPETLFVISAANDGVELNAENLDDYGYAGADLPNVMTIAATDANDELASFSNYGVAHVQLAAPGVDILSAGRNNQYVRMSGTSMAAPAVANAAAKLLVIAPHLRPNIIKHVLMATVTRHEHLQGVVAAGGVLNADRAYNVAYVLARVEQGESVARAVQELELPAAEHQVVALVARQSVQMMRDNP